MTDQANRRLTIEQAAEWWVVLCDGSCSDAERHEFFDWVNRSPDRIEAFLWVVATHSALRSPRLRWPTAPEDTIVRAALTNHGAAIQGPWEQAPQQVAASSRKRMPPRSSRRRWSLVAATIVAVVAMSLWLSNVWFGIPHRYDTGIGEQRSIVLSDGTIVTLNTRSRMTVRMNRASRTVQLTTGEALFQVAKDPHRAFIVTSGAASIRAVGTEFNVRSRTTDDVITVIEGRIEVVDKGQSFATQANASGAPVRLAVGEQVIVARDGTEELRKVADLGRVTAWTQRYIVLDDQPLAEVALEFNRYNERRFIIADRELAQRRISGVFTANDLDSFVDFLRSIPTVEIRTLSNGDQLVERRTPR